MGLIFNGFIERNIKNINLLIYDKIIFPKNVEIMKTIVARIFAYRLYKSELSRNV